MFSWIILKLVFLILFSNDPTLPYYGKWLAGKKNYWRNRKRRKKKKNVQQKETCAIFIYQHSRGANTNLTLAAANVAIMRHAICSTNEQKQQQRRSEVKPELELE